MINMVELSDRELRLRKSEINNHVKPIVVLCNNGE